MKLRIKNDSLRLRLSHTEVDQFAADGAIEDRVTFGASSDQALSYALEKDSTAHSLTASISNNRITISIPSRDADEWTSTKKVGFEIEQDLGEGRVLTIVVEKDFKRLKPRSAEDVDDKFPHPRSDS